MHWQYLQTCFIRYTLDGNLVKETRSVSIRSVRSPSAHQSTVDSLKVDNYGDKCNSSVLCVGRLHKVCGVYRVGGGCWNVPRTPSATTEQLKVVPDFLTTVLGLQYPPRLYHINYVRGCQTKSHTWRDTSSTNASQVSIEVTSGTVDFISFSVLCGVAYFNQLLHLNELHSQEGWQVKHNREKIEFGLDGIDKNEMGRW